MPKFNPSQLSTIEEAKTLIAQLEPFKIGNGVAPLNSENDYVNEVSGVFLLPWAAVEGAPEPREGESRSYMLRYNPTPDGIQASGFNVGIIRDMMKVNGHPLSYVARHHKGEVDDQIANIRKSKEEEERKAAEAAEKKQK